MNKLFSATQAASSGLRYPSCSPNRNQDILLGSNKTNLNDGAFAEYIAVKGDLQIKIQDTLSDEEAASLGVGISTVVSALDGAYSAGT